MSPHDRIMGKANEEGLSLDAIIAEAWREGVKYGAEDAKHEVLGFIQRTGASVETLKAWLEKGEQ